MTDLASRIASLRAADRAIDAAVATLVGWWPDNSQEIVNSAFSRLLINEDRIPYGTANAPRFTASLDSTLAEIVRRGWYFSVGNIDPTSAGAFANIWPNGFDYIGQALRSDEIATLAACEALVRAVESIAGNPSK